MIKVNGTNSNTTFLTKRLNSKTFIGSGESALIYHRDRERIIRSKSFKQLKKKTCLNSVTGDNLFTHTYEVSRIANQIGKQLRLNEELIQSIVLGQSFGCAPFGDVGERVLKNLTAEKFEAIGTCPAQHCGFKSNLQSLHMLDKVEMLTNHYNGLNLTLAVREGIVKQNKYTFSENLNTHAETYICDDLNIHYRHLDLSDIDFSKPPMTLEGQLVTVANKIAVYVHHLENALKMGTVRIEDLNPIELVSKCSDVLSIYKTTSKKSQKVNEMLISSLVQSIQNDLILDVSLNTVIELNKLPANPDYKKKNDVFLKKYVVFSDDISSQLEDIKKIIQNKRKDSKEHIKFEQDVKMMMTSVYDYYEEKPEKLPDYLTLLKNNTTAENALMKNRMISDAISIMSDDELVTFYHKIKDTK